MSKKIEQIIALTRQQQIDRLRIRYPEGTRLELVQMDDPQAPPAGMHGTVLGVDDMANILVEWDNGSSLNLIPNVDRWRKLTHIEY